MKKNMLFLTTLAGLTASSTGIPFSNPVFPVNTPDPTCWQADGKYYLASTHGWLLESDDLVSWKKSRGDFLAPGERGDIKKKWRGIWAPDVVKIGKTWNLYISLWNGPQNTAIASYVSDRPEGPFTNRTVITESRKTGISDSIDAEVLVDPETGKTWMFFGSIGRIHRIELAPDGRSTAPGAKYEHVAGLSIMGQKNRDRVFEGSYLHRRDGWWYLFVSSGYYSNHSYSIKVGRAKRLTDDFTDRTGRSMKDGFAETILSSQDGDRFFGPGHNGEIFTTGSGRTYMLYHCHDLEGKPNKDHRMLFLQEVLWGKDGWPFFEPGRPAKSGILR